MLIDVMQNFHLSGIDLNLLVILSALVAEENVTRAGKHVGLSQSAMSHALARLRTMVDDPILVRAKGGRMTATHRAKSLAASVNEGLVTLERALEEGRGFDPLTSTRTFTLGMSDYSELVLLPPLLARLRKEAPGVNLWVVSADVGIAEKLTRDELDLVVAPMREDEASAGIASEVLFEERFVCMMRKGHPLARSKLTLAPRGLRGSYADDALAEVGKQRRVMVGVPHFLIVPHLVASSDLIVTIAERVARTFADSHALAIVSSPVQLPRFEMSQIWHARDESDPGHAWLRGVLREVSANEITSRERSRQGKVREAR
jgi:DNA-binding transcriptional LysR family regulator